jgi:hypothetical protein
MLPSDFGPWKTVCHYYRAWQGEGYWTYLISTIGWEFWCAGPRARTHSPKSGLEVWLTGGQDAGRMPAAAVGLLFTSYLETR